MPLQFTSRVKRPVQYTDHVWLVCRHK